MAVVCKGVNLTQVRLFRSMSFDAPAFLSLLTYALPPLLLPLRLLLNLFPPLLQQSCCVTAT